MRMSCNGCRVLRKGCSDDCSLRPCLDWIKTPESQANATVFLAKFYGRAGLMNLLNAGPEHLRPAIFRSLLYEACGRIVNPIYGSVGLLWSGNWNHCQNAVDAVLGGSQIMEVPCDTAAIRPILPLKAYDIRHLSKEANSPHDLHKAKTRSRFKRCGARSKPHLDSAEFCNPGWNQFSAVDYNHNRAPSHDSSLIQQETDSMFSVETVEPSLATPPKPNQLPKADGQTDKTEAGLELTLGFYPISRPQGCKLEMGP